jgi:hypothetical protein
MEEVGEAPMTHYPRATVDNILRRVAGGEALTHVLESNAGFPSKQTWFRWVSKYPELSAQYVASVQLAVANRRYNTK